MMRVPDYLKRFTYTPNEFYDYLVQVEKAMAGELVLVVTPATLGSSAAAVVAAIAAADNDKYVRTVKVELRDADDGSLHEWFTGTFAAAATYSTAGNGEASLPTDVTTVSLENGVGYINIEYTGTWAEADTQTLTITGGDKLGYSVTNKTSVDTLVE